MIDEIVTVPDKEAFHYANLLSKKEGLGAGPSCGAAVAAARKCLVRHSGVIATVLPDGLDRYLSMVE